MNILCADIGTTSIKTGIISEAGELLAFRRDSCATEKSDFTAETWLKTFIFAAKELLKQTKAKICAISLSGNGPTLSTQSGKVLLWNVPIPQQNTNATQNSHSLFIPRLVAFKKLFPRDYAESEYIFSNPEYLIWRLTNKAVTILPQEQYSPAYWTKELLEAAGLDSKKLPPFVPAGFNAGLTSQNATNLLELCAPVPVFCGGPDFFTALVGTNTLIPGALCDRAGSSEGLNLCTKEPLNSSTLRILPGARSGVWNASYLIPKSGILLNEYKNQLEALEQTEFSYEEIIDICFDDKNSEGYRLLNTLCEELKKGLTELRTAYQKTGLTFPKKMIVTGGQAKNARWLSEKARLCGIDLEVTNCPDAELLGNAIIALTSLKKFNSITEAAAFIVKPVAHFSHKADETKKAQVFNIPKEIRTIIFDIDSTLYTSAAYAFEQVDVQIRHFAQKNGITAQEARNKITSFRRTWQKEHDGKKISLGNTLTHFGVTIEESIKMREDLLEPERFLSHDERLIKTLSELKSRYNLICVTNNPVLPARKTLEALGISSIIKEIIGLDTCKVSKPALAPFEEALKRTNSLPQNTVSVGDRYDMDIALPLKMGMGGVLVNGVQDIYRLPELLST